MAVNDGITILVSMLFIGSIAAAGLYFIPKSQEQVVHRTALVMTLVCCWLMWVITFMAQMNPIIKPERSWGSE
ncbi:hypothetical protein SmJEL517_g04871 [Synchytrium microbalum]|uniref:Uncharacterized protein n=1 Tax=Synchytrium microbalum TaxID=1806994 RepID=A0A507C333_9FUNG|nr:uncharacterized protein SmJEL517_g04871 [Synchytrium microbalum]TPX31923.1 hypothetical protein SmJEL517_g04871 [Synchytrium microbalum]